MILKETISMWLKEQILSSSKQTGLYKFKKTTTLLKTANLVTQRVILLEFYNFACIPCP